MQTGPPSLNPALTHGTDAMRVLHFAPRVCWPLDTGAKLRNYHLAREVSRSAQITLLAFSETSEQTASDHKPAAGAGRADESTVDPPLARPEEFYERVRLIARGRGYTPGKVLRGAF